MPLTRGARTTLMAFSGIFSTFIAYYFAAGEQLANPITLTITQETKQCRVGKPCSIKVMLINMSAEVVPVRIDVGELTTFMNYRMDVKRKDGKLVVQRDPLNPGDGAIIAPMFSEETIPFSPGQSTYEVFALGDAVKIKRPGTYLIKVQRDNKTHGPYWTTTSNTLAVTYTR